MTQYDTAEMVRDIWVGRLKPYKQRQSGGKDIELKSVLTKEEIEVDRNTLKEQFMGIDGKAIKLFAVKEGRMFGLLRNTQTQEFYVKYGKENDNAEPKYYIMDKDGEVLFTVDRQIFRKAFRLHKSTRLNLKRKEETLQRKVDKLKNQTQPTTQTTQATQPQTTQTTQPTRTQTPTPKARYKAIRRIEHDSKTVGLVLLDSITNRQVKVNLTNIKRMAKEGEITNIETVTKQNKQFIRGNGIRIGELPSEQV